MRSGESIPSELTLWPLSSIKEIYLTGKVVLKEAQMQRHNPICNENADSSVLQISTLLLLTNKMNIKFTLGH